MNFSLNLLVSFLQLPVSSHPLDSKSFLSPCIPLFLLHPPSFCTNSSPFYLLNLSFNISVLSLFQYKSLLLSFLFYLSLSISLFLNGSRITGFGRVSYIDQRAVGLRALVDRCSALHFCSLTAYTSRHDNRLSIIL